MEPQGIASPIKKFEPLYILKEKATIHMKQKRYAWAMVYLTDALKEIDKVIESIEEEDEMEILIKQLKLPCHKNLSLCHLKQSNYEGCIEHCKQTLQIEPNCIKILYRIGVAWMHIKDYQQAETYLQKAYLLDPNEKQVMKALEKIEITKRNSRKVSPVVQPDHNVTVGTVLKYLFFWPILLFLYVWEMLTKSVKEKIK